MFLKIEDTEVMSKCHVIWSILLRYIPRDTIRSMSVTAVRKVRCLQPVVTTSSHHAVCHFLINMLLFNSEA